ncbi:FAD-binding oxidoreductase [Marinovum sp.]|uniref:FAD-binding oxidoreductase n=1 Tax=Marinovum sp. TaxID=2024839 RepID=UPI002B2691B8|nr:FAD-binding oxidoreductase [Marinovum sp.]
MTDLSPADAGFAARLAEELPADTLRPAEPRYLEEPRGHWQGQGGYVALPRSADEVARIVAACNTARVGLLPFGGGTGLVGGQVQPAGPPALILSLERMNAIRALYPEENVLVAEAGAILADIQAAATGADRLFPLSLASEGSARIGGCLATNAGGVNVLRYGNARALCLGLEAVLPDGTLWNGLQRLYKDNTGYDLRNLLIGAEGTLGVITAASLRLSPRPAATGTAMVVVESPAAALRLLGLARDIAGEAVSVFELIGRTGLDFLAEKLPQVRQPFADRPEWSVLIELGMSAGQDPMTALETIFAGALEEGLASDGVIASSEAQRAGLWAVREEIPTANRMIGAISSHDIALPLSLVPEFIDRAPEALSDFPDIRINCFGHLGDGNLHYNVFPAEGRSKSDYAGQRDAIQRAVHDLCVDMGGSFSAEHGLGRLKVADLERYGDPARLAAMRAIKRALDPQGIMNPGAVLRA